MHIIISHTTKKMEILRQKIDLWIDKTFDIISKIGNERDGVTANNSTDIKIIFPAMRKTDSHEAQYRISEQELKQIFIEQLVKDDNDYKYSVETPTTERYCFEGNIENGGRSASIDLTIHSSDGKTRLAIIEFKFSNGRTKNIKKDFEKLRTDSPEDKPLRYFIHLIEAYSERTHSNIEEKYKQVRKTAKGHFNVYEILRTIDNKIIKLKR